MAVGTTKDGRHFVYWKKKGGGQGRKYFGRGLTERTKAEAHDAARRVKRAATRKARGPLFKDLAKAYKQEKDFSENSLKQLGYRMRAYVPHFGHRKAMAMTHHDLKAYVEGRRSGKIGIRRKPVKDNTILREINDIKAIFNWAANLRDPALTPFDPVAKFRGPKADDAVIIPPSGEEARRIYNAAPDHLRRFILLSWYLGLRPGKVEVLSQLTWDKVNWETRKIRVVSAHKGGPKMRDVPIHKKFLHTLWSWYEKDKADLDGLIKKAAARKAKKKKSILAPVPENVKHLAIVHYGGHRIQYSIQTVWKNTLKLAGITRRLRPYDLRHHFATRILEKGGDKVLKSLSEVMGSAPQTLIKHYQHVTDALADATVNLIPELELETEAISEQSKEKQQKGAKIIDITKKISYKEKANG